MQNLMNELDLVFKMISKIPVTGDSVDLMAFSREKLRHIYKALAEMDNQNESVPDSAD